MGIDAEGYTLDIRCDDPAHEWPFESAPFYGTTKVFAYAEMRAAGWRLTRSNVATCPRCRKRNAAARENAS